MAQLTVRVDDHLSEGLRRLPHEGDRSLSDTYRAALETYVALVQLSELRADRKSPRAVERLLEDIGLALYGAMSARAQTAFLTHQRVAGDSTTAADFAGVLRWLGGASNRDVLADFSSEDLVRLRAIATRMLEERS